LTEAEELQLTPAYLTERIEAFQMLFRDMEAGLETEISRLALVYGLSHGQREAYYLASKHENHAMYAY